MSNLDFCLLILSKTTKKNNEPQLQRARKLADGLYLDVQILRPVHADNPEFNYFTTENGEKLAIKLK